MDGLLWLLGLLIVVLVVAAIVRSQIDIVTVHDYERGLRFRRGVLQGVLGPGAYVTVRALGEIRRMDARPTMLPIEGQDILTADGVTAKVSLVARYVLGDPVAAVIGDADYWTTLRLHLQLALRDAIARRTLEEALAARREIGPEVREACAGPMAVVGIELLDVEVRDVMLPAEVRRAYAGVVAARKQGEADLERVRAETASLRALANAGRLLDDNPGLVQLRVLQALGEGSGHTIVYGVPEAPAPAARPARPRPARGGSAADTP